MGLHFPIHTIRQEGEERVSFFEETYSEYKAFCGRCKAAVLEVIECLDIESWDEECGVCSSCKKVYCKDCLTLEDDVTYCPDCGMKLMDFYGFSVYDLIHILQNNCQPFKGATE